MDEFEALYNGGNITTKTENDTRTPRPEQGYS